MLSWYNMILHHKILTSVVMTNLVSLSLLWIDQRFNPRSPCWGSLYSHSVSSFLVLCFHIEVPGSCASSSIIVCHNPQLSRKLKLQSTLLLYNFEVFCLFVLFVCAVFTRITKIIQDFNALLQEPLNYTLFDDALEFTLLGNSFIFPYQEVTFFQSFILILVKQLAKCKWKLCMKKQRVTLQCEQNKIIN